MTGSRALLSLACFGALAVTAALVAGRVTSPGLTPLLLAVVIAATLAGAPGAVRARAWPLALFLLPLGAYLLARLQVPVPASAHGAAAHLAFYVGRVGAGAGAYGHDVFPLDVAANADLRLLLSLVVYAAVGAASFLALSLRRPLPAIVILLVLAGFGFTTDASAHALVPALAFVVLAGGLLALMRPAQHARWRWSDVLIGGVTATLAAVIALSILGTTTVEAGRPLRDWRTWRIAGAADEVFQFDGMQNYPRPLQSGADELVMKVRSPVPSYWRANVLSDFTGVSWKSDASGTTLLPKQLSGRDWVYQVPPVQPVTQGRLVTQTFAVEGTYTDRLFVGGWPEEMRAPLPLELKLTEGWAVAVDPPRGPTVDYSVTAVVPDLGPTDLIGRGRNYPVDVRRRDTALPFPGRESHSSEAAWEAAAAGTEAGREWAGLYRLNDQIVGAETDPYRVALTIEQYLRSRYNYSLRPPDTGFESPYAAFLLATHTGYCQHFGGAMAVLLRFNGIPARVVVGFTTGEERNGEYVVTRNDAHSWVEAYFPGVGWAPFDPTPGHVIPSADAAPTSGPGAEAAAGLGAGGASATRRHVGASGKGRVNDLGGSGGPLVAPSEQGSDRWPLIAAVAILLVVWPAGRALLRRRGLLRGPVEARLEASLSLLYADLRDHGVEVPSSHTIDETARSLDERLGVDTGDLPARIQAVVFGGRAAKAADLGDLAALRRRVHVQLRVRAGWVRALLALYGVRTSSRRRGPERPAALTRTPLARRVS